MDIRFYKRLISDSWIILLCLTVIPTITVVSQTLLTSNTERFCPEGIIVFTCTTTGSSIIAWSSQEFIGSGSQIEFNSFGRIGEIKLSSSNPGTIANLTAVNNTGTVRLTSTLHIVTTSATSTVSVSCINVAGGETNTSTILPAGVPGIPQNVSAAEISPPTGIDSICRILVTWDPPTSDSGSDIDHYIVNVPLRGVSETEFSGVSILSVPNCRDGGIRIQVAAVNRFGCVGLPYLLAVEDEPTNTTSTDGGSTISRGTTSESNFIAVIIVSALVFILLIIVVVLTILMIWCFRQKGRHVKVDEDIVEDLQDIRSQKLDEDLHNLYLALRSQYDAERRRDLEDKRITKLSLSDTVITNAMERLKEGLKKSLPHLVQDALKKLLEILKWERHDDIRKALDKLMQEIAEMSSINDVKNEVERLKGVTESTSEETLRNALNELKRKVEQANPDNIKKIVLKLCEELLKTLPKLSDAQDTVVNEFEIPLESLKEIQRLLAIEFDKGLEREGDDVKVKMLNTYVHAMPNGTEEGDFLGLDLGTNKLRVRLIKIHNGIQEQGFVEHFIDDKTKQSTQEVLFDFIAKCAAEFIKKQNITKRLPVGFSFAFAVKKESLNSGTLIRWVKAYKATGAVGKDVVQLLKAAFDRRGDVEVDVLALVNDATATQLSVGSEDPRCNIGLILSKGTNACYMESLDAVPKFKGDRSHYSQVIINTEWGSFGDDGLLDKWRTSYDHQLQDKVFHRGKLTYEKLISDKYLGEIVRLTLKDLIHNGALFGGKISTKFDTFEAFGRQHMSTIEEGNKSDCKKIFKNYFSMKASDEDCEVVRKVCEAVSTRAARLVATGIVALVKKMHKLDGCTVAVAGSLYRCYPLFAQRIRKAMDELEPENGINVKLAEDTPGRGAAIAAAVAHRLAKSISPESLDETEAVAHLAGHLQDPKHKRSDINAASGSKKGPSGIELQDMNSAAIEQ